jgi:IS1 family transposase
MSIQKLRQSIYDGYEVLADETDRLIELKEETYQTEQEIKDIRSTIARKIRELYQIYGERP